MFAVRGDIPSQRYELLDVGMNCERQQDVYPVYLVKHSTSRISIIFWLRIEFSKLENNNPTGHASFVHL